MSRTRLRAVIVVLGGALAVDCPGRAHAQFAPITTELPQVGGPIGDADRRIPEGQPYETREIQSRQLKRLRLEHQQELMDDTVRLVRLATALKAEVDQGTQPTALPIDALKQADEITKLAKKLSERIKSQ